MNSKMCRQTEGHPIGRRKGTAVPALALMVVLALCLAWGPTSAFSQTDGTGGGQTDDENVKQAQTGMKWLGVSLAPRAAALGGATTTLHMGAVSMFNNPAGMAYLEGLGNFSAGTMQYIADINYTQGTLAIRPSGGTYGVFGAFARAVDYGDLEGTIRANNNAGYLSTGPFSPSALAVGVGYAIGLTDRVAIGAAAKYVREDLGESVMSVDDSGTRTTQENVATTPSFDFGVLYDTGFRGMTFGMSVRNFSPAVKFEEESFELPLLLSVGLSADLFNVFKPASTLSENHTFLLSVDAFTPRDFSEHFRIGGEYTFMDLLSLRAGYAYPTDRGEKGLSLGAGLHLAFGGFELGADYAYTRFGTFGSVNHIGVNFSF